MVILAIISNWMWTMNVKQKWSWRGHCPWSNFPNHTQIRVSRKASQGNHWNWIGIQSMKDSCGASLTVCVPFQNFKHISIYSVLLLRCWSAVRSTSFISGRPVEFVENNRGREIRSCSSSLPPFPTVNSSTVKFHNSVSVTVPFSVLGYFGWFVRSTLLVEPSDS